MPECNRELLDLRLISELEENDFDLAGMIDSVADAWIVEKCLQTLEGIVRRAVQPESGSRLQMAHAIVALVAVARDEYAHDGQSEYWTFLYDRMAKASYVPDLQRSTVLLTQKRRDLLADWFKSALEEFDYSVPDSVLDGGQTLIGPIVFHAGIPDASMEKVLRVIEGACEIHGEAAATLSRNDRYAWVESSVGHLHMGTKRLFGSRLRGAEQLWECLTRVVLAWNRGDCECELSNLPQAINRDVMRRVLSVKAEWKTVPRPYRPLPRIRYDFQTGRISAFIPEAESAHFHVIGCHGLINLDWERTPRGMVAEFRLPLPTTLTIRHVGADANVEHKFFTRPPDWHGLWFRTSDGGLEEGAGIGDAGIAAGRWYVICEGLPRFPDEVRAEGRQLMWGDFQHRDDPNRWTAWEVEIPPRDAGMQRFEAWLGENCWHVPLARRPGPRLAVLSNPLAEAETLTGVRVQVFTDSPVVRLLRTSELDVVLLKETSRSALPMSRLTLSPDIPQAMPVIPPGTYVLREARGIGRILLRFALIPDLELSEPLLSADAESATIRCRAESNHGEFSTALALSSSTRKDVWEFRISTIDPVAEVAWTWRESDAVPLTFSRSIPGIRWRVLGLGPERERWTRDTIVLDSKEVTSSDARLDIQVHPGAHVIKNGVAIGPFRPGDRLQHELYAVTAVELCVDGQVFHPVLKSERPQLKWLKALSDEESIVLEWSETFLPAETSVLLWNPQRIRDEPHRSRLLTEDVERRSWTGQWSELPSGDWTCVTLARKQGLKTWFLAAVEPQPEVPYSLLINRRTGEVLPLSDCPDTWGQFVQRLSHTRFRGGDWLMSGRDSALQCLAAKRRLPFREAATYLDGLGSAAHSNLGVGAQGDSLRGVRESLVSALSAQLGEDDGEIWNSSHVPFVDLLERGLPAGQFCLHPLQKAGAEIPDDAVYPIRYLQDLYRLGELCTPRAGNIAVDPDESHARSVEAAHRVVRFHVEHQLPDPVRFLPVARTSARVENTDHGHRHEFDLRWNRTDPVGGQFCEGLALDDLIVDVEEAQRSPVPGAEWSASKIPRPLSLTWCADQWRWAIEVANGRYRLCCHTLHEPLIVPPPSANAFCEEIELLKRLRAWSAGLNVDGVEDFRFLNSMHARLTGDPSSGEMHARVLAESRSDCGVLFGQSVTVSVNIELPVVARIAWVLAWVERQSAWEGPFHYFGTAGYASSTFCVFQRALARALREWPRLMRRCLALSEILYWTMHRDGLGIAARFQSPLPRRSYAHLSGAIESSPSIPSAGGGHVAEVTNVQVQGICIGFEDGEVFVLLSAAGAPIRADDVFRFVASRDLRGLRIASLSYGDLPKEVRRQLGDRLQERKRRMPTVPTFTADVVCGLAVTCDLRLEGRWTATNVIVDLNRPSLRIPPSARYKPL